MNMTNRIKQVSAVTALLTVLAGCGGSDSSAGSSADSATFTVSLAAVDVHRVSNDADVSVMTTGIDSGELTLQR